MSKEDSKTEFVFEKNDRNKIIVFIKIEWKFERQINARANIKRKIAKWVYDSDEHDSKQSTVI